MVSNLVERNRRRGDRGKTKFGGNQGTVGWINPGGRSRSHEKNSRTIGGRHAQARGPTFRQDGRTKIAEVNNWWRNYCWRGQATKDKEIEKVKIYTIW